MWSGLIFNTVATRAFRLWVVSNWKLDSSNTYSSGARSSSAPASSRSHSSNAGVPRLPPTAARTPARSVIAPNRVVTVLLPLEPVMAAIGARVSRASNSMSPQTGTPRAAAAAMTGVAIATPGLTSSRAAPANASGAKPPRWHGTSGNASRKTGNPGGSTRLSVTATVAPSAFSARTVDKPLLPNPTTNVVPVNRSIRALLLTDL